MKNLFRYFLYLILLSFLVAGISLITELRNQKDLFFLSIRLIESVLNSFPVIAPLSLFWGLVFKSKKDFQFSPSKAGVTFSVFSYLFIVLVLIVFLQEVFLPSIDEGNKSFPQFSLLKKKTQRKSTFSMTPSITSEEFSVLGKLPSKKNIAFKMGDVFVYIGRMYKGEIFYASDIRIIGYSAAGKIDFIVSAKYGKFLAGNIYPSSVTVIDYSRKISKIFQDHPSRKIPIMYSPEAIYKFASDENIERVSLIDVFRFSDFLFSSRINFVRLGSMIYNKVIYYIILFFLIIFSSLLGGKYSMTRPIYREYFEFISAVVVSSLGVILTYDILISFAKIVYELLVT